MESTDGTDGLGDHRTMRLSLAFAIQLTAGLMPASALADHTPQRSVLVLDQSDISGPLFHRIFEGMLDVFNSSPDNPVTVYFESLDFSRFTGSAYEESLQRHFSIKYRDKGIGIVMPVGDASLKFLMEHRADLWPDSAVVFSQVNEATVEKLKPAPNVTGITMRFRLADMVKAARAVVPGLEGVALVGDAWESQVAYRHWKDEVPDATEGLEIIDLINLPMRELLKRVATLPGRSAIIYSAIYSDGKGNFYPPVRALDLLSSAANRPIIISVDTYLRHGGVGGFVMVPKLLGQAAAAMALKILNGQNVENIPVGVGDVVRPIFDWRQMQRWGVDKANLPPGSEIRFKDPAIWDQYRWQLIAIFGVLLFQSALLVGLIVERHRRHAAEEETRQRIRQVIHLNRTATAGALSASVAHELNQPLGAILNYAETAAILLSQNAVNVPQLKEIIADIRRDDQRASEIIKHLRGLLKQKSEVDSQTFDLNEAINVATRILEPEAIKRGIALDTVENPNCFPVRADRVQLQQVILNLLTNGMDAVSSSPTSRRRLLIQAIPSGDSEVEVVVSDLGPGIPKDGLNRIFETFYTTKSNGTGLGLSIARTIIEAHGGRIWAENREGGGAVLRFTIPLAQPPVLSIDELKEQEVPSSVCLAHR
jgi:signal transduction histidine kinase